MEIGQPDSTLPTTPPPPAPPAAPLPCPPPVSERSLRHLRGTKPWVRLLSVLMFIGVGFMILAGLVMMVGMSFIPMPENELPGPLGALPGIALGGFYIACSMLYLFPAIYLSRYAKAIDALLRLPSMNGLEDALGHQKSFWKFIGVMTVVSMVVGVIGIIAAITIPLLLMVLGKGGGGPVSF